MSKDMRRTYRISLFALLALGLASTASVAAAEGEWTMTGRTYDLQRFSPLAKINAQNVASLQAAWTFSTGVLRGHEGNPLVIGKVMYVHSAFPNIVFALDLTKPGAPMIWKHVPAQPADTIPVSGFRAKMVIDHLLSPGR